MRRVVALFVFSLTMFSGLSADGAILTGQQIKIDRLNHVSTGDSSSANNSDPGGDYVISATYGGRGGGGEFLLTQLAAPGEIIKTFCLEKDEFIALPGTYYVSRDTVVKAGGGGPNPDPIDDRTMWLYYWYVNNLLDDGTTAFKYEAAFSSNELQEAIWNIEQESSTIDGLGLALKNKAAAAGAWNPNNGTVYALNLWQNYNSSTGEFSGGKQSQLYWVSRQGGAGGEVPEPASFAIWSLISMAGVLAYRRRILA